MNTPRTTYEWKGLRERAYAVLAACCRSIAPDANSTRNSRMKSRPLQHKNISTNQNSFHLTFEVGKGSERNRLSQRRELVAELAWTWWFLRSSNVTIS